jgi:hypothetical protein
LLLVLVLNSLNFTLYLPTHEVGRVGHSWQTRYLKMYP